MYPAAPNLALVLVLGVAEDGSVAHLADGAYAADGADPPQVQRLVLSRSAGHRILSGGSQVESPLQFPQDTLLAAQDNEGDETLRVRN